MLYGKPNTARNPGDFSAKAPKNGDFIQAVQDAASYAATDDSVKALWVEVPDGTVAGAKRQNGQWVNPVIPVVHLRVVDANAFFALFTPLEEVGIRDYMDARPDPDPPQTLLMRKAIGVMMGRLERAVNVNLDLAANIEGMQLLVAAGLITQERAAEILAGPVV